LTANRVIEYFGLSKLNLVTENVLPLFELFGRFPFPEDQVEHHLAELKKKTAIEEKNKKLRQQKKPEEPVPQLDNIEEITRKKPDGETIKEWVTIKNPQFKHLNFCMNDIDEGVKDKLEQMFENTTDDFGVTLSSNKKISEEVIEKLHKKITAIH